MEKQREEGERSHTRGDQTYPALADAFLKLGCDGGLLHLAGDLWEADVRGGERALGQRSWRDESPATPDDAPEDGTHLESDTLLLHHFYDGGHAVGVSVHHHALSV